MSSVVPEDGDHGTSSPLNHPASRRWAMTFFFYNVIVTHPGSKRSRSRAKRHSIDPPGGSGLRLQDATQGVWKPLARRTCGGSGGGGGHKSHTCRADHLNLLSSRSMSPSLYRAPRLTGDEAPDGLPMPGGEAFRQAPEARRPEGDAQEGAVPDSGETAGSSVMQR